MMRTRGSLRWRLPLMICLLLTAATGAFAVVAYQRVQVVLLEASASRAQGAAVQLAALLAPSAENSMQQITRMADLPAVRAYIAEPTAARESAAVAALRAALPVPTTRQTIEIWTPSKTRLLTLARGGGHAGGDAASEAPAGVGPRPIRVIGDTLVLETAVNAGPSSASPAAILLARSEVRGASSIEAIQRMLGDGAVIRIGTPGHVWTDLVRAVGTPSTEAVGVTDPEASKRLGAVVANVTVRSAPWVVSIEQSLDQVLAPAHGLLRAFGLAAVLVVGGAAVAGFLLTGRITKPLAALSNAASSIAAGDYAKRVIAGGNDEIGRLALAFNTMSQTVEDHHARLEARVEDRTRELESFSYSVSHDLRAPLRHVIGFAGLLQRHAADSLDADARRYVGTITTAAGRMSRLIDDLLAFSRMGRTPIAKRRVSLSDLVEEARHEVLAQAGNRRIEWNVGELPETWGDPDLLRLALVNLFSNAVKYTGTRDVARIEVAAARSDGDLIVSVRDNGVGFDPAYASKLFGVFQRLHRAEEFEGTGIGLANVRQVINRHGGRTWADGELDAGATFYISLPLADADNKEQT